MAKTGKGSGIPEGGFKDREQLEAWLDGQPREVAIAIAWRSAARVFPLLAGEKPDAVILPVLRAIAVSRFAAMWPNRETEQVKSAAASPAAIRSLSASLSAAYSAAYSAADSAAFPPPFPPIPPPVPPPIPPPIPPQFRRRFRRFRRRFRRHLGPSHQRCAVV
jgi:hypothetical protein